MERRADGWSKVSEESGGNGSGTKRTIGGTATIQTGTPLLRKRMRVCV